MSLRLVLLSLLVLLNGCSSIPVPRERPDPSRTTRPTSDTNQPKGLVIEKEIKGQLLRLNLSQPAGLAASRDGTVYICDAGNNRIIRLDEELIARADTRGYGREEGGLDRPAFIWLDNSLNLVVADPGNRRLVWFDHRLNYVDELELIDEEDPLKFGEIASVAGTSYGELWVADWEMGRIAVFSNVNQFQSFVGDFGYSGGQVSRPEKLLPERDRGFLLCDAGNSRIVHYDNYGNLQRELRDDLLTYPIAASQGEKKGLWVLEGGSGQVFYFDHNWSRVYVTGPSLAGSSQPLKDPTDILLLDDNRLLISDTGNNRVLLCRIYYE